jgi:hypothetical protein
MKAKQLIEMLDRTTFEATSYSGRGMRGSECVAVITEQKNLASFIVEIIHSFVESDEFEENRSDFNELCKVLGRTRQDNMGRDDVVYYWPDVEREDDEK